jgi:hypothetical protein
LQGFCFSIGEGYHRGQGAGAVAAPKRKTDENVSRETFSLKVRFE